MPNYTCAGHEYKHSREGVNNLVRDYECSNCKTNIELFWDDSERACFNCGELIKKPPKDLIGDLHLSCITSCPSPEICGKSNLVKKLKKALEEMERS